MLLTKFQFIWPSRFRGEGAQKFTIPLFFHNLTLILLTFVRAIFLKFFGGENICFLSSCEYIWRVYVPSFSSFGQAVSEEKVLRNCPIRNQNCLWRPCLSTDRDEMSNLYSGTPNQHAMFLIGQFLNTFSSETTWPN
jgi:hypothetical protein